MPRCRCCEFAVVVCGKVGQSPQERDRIPNLVVTMLGPGRHPRHFDPMFDDPEQFGRLPVARSIGQLRRGRIHVAHPFLGFHSRRRMAVRAMRRIVYGTARNFFLTIKILRCGYSACTRFDGTRTYAFHYPVRDGPVPIVGRDIVDPRKYEDYAARYNCHYDRQGPDYQSTAHPRIFLRLAPLGLISSGV